MDIDVEKEIRELHAKIGEKYTIQCDRNCKLDHCIHSNCQGYLSIREELTHQRAFKCLYCVNCRFNMSKDIDSAKKEEYEMKKKSDREEDCVMATGMMRGDGEQEYYEYLHIPTNTKWMSLSKNPLKAWEKFQEKQEEL